MNSIKFLVISIFLFYSCSLYVEDLKTAYVERDGIYQVSDKQGTMKDDIFYSSFFNNRKTQIENISSKNDFVTLKKDTMYREFLAINYYGYDIEKPKIEPEKESVKIAYQREEIYYVDSDEEYQEIENQYNNNFSAYSFYDDFFQEYHYFGNHSYYFQDKVYRENTKKIETQNQKNYSPQRERKNYQEFRQNNQNNNNIRNNNEYNRRATNRRRR